MTPPNYKDYLGDSVYAEFDGYHIILTTDNGHGPSNRIALERNVINAFKNYVDVLIAKLKEQKEKENQ